MTFDAKSPLATPTKMILEESADIGIVAGNTGHGQVIARISGFLSDRMSKAHVFFMALTADCIHLAFQHRRMITAVQLMTVRAGIPLGMPVQHAGATFERIGVTGPA